MQPTDDLCLICEEQRARLVAREQVAYGAMEAT
jgi:hypothetical protein